MFMLQFAFALLLSPPKEKYLVLLRFSTVILVFMFAASIGVSAQTGGAKPTPSPTPAPTPVIALNSKDTTKVFTAEQIAESAIFVYGFGGGRTLLDQIRKTAIEKGKTIVTNADGKVDRASYTRFVMRGADLAKDKVRLDQDFPNARYGLISNDDKVVLVFNNTVLTPSDEAAATFENTIYRGIEGLLRYKEGNSKIELAGREKQLGVEFYMVDVTDAKGRLTRYYVSVKSLRIMQLTYEVGGIKYRRKFYDYKYAQGTLVPYRTVLTANDKVIEETDIGTVTFGQKVDEDLFKAN